MDLLQELEGFGFNYRGNIELDKDCQYPIFKLVEDANEHITGNVYLWIVKKYNANPIVIYIGLTNKTINERYKNGHTPGFRRKPGKRLSDALLIYLNEDPKTKILVYAKPSSKITLFGQESISICDAEETALIIRFQKHPLLNKSKNKKQITLSDLK